MLPYLQPRNSDDVDFLFKTARQVKSPTHLLKRTLSTSESSEPEEPPSKLRLVENVLPSNDTGLQSETEISDLLSPDRSKEMPSTMSMLTYPEDGEVSDSEHEDVQDSSQDDQDQSNYRSGTDDELEN